jgi:hypothetical protein
VSASGGTAQSPVAPADVLAGYQGFAATTAATTVITVPAGRTWVGTVTIQCAAAEVAAGLVAATATGIVSTAGVGVTPAAGTVLRCDALVAANAAGGTISADSASSVSQPLIVVAPAGNPVQVQAAATIAGTAGQVNVTASGVLQ